MYGIRIASILVAFGASMALAASANELTTEEQALVIFAENDDRLLTREEISEIVRETVETHLQEQEIHRLDAETQTLVKFKEVYPHFACTFAQPTPEEKQPTNETRLFIDTALYRSENQGMGACDPTQSNMASMTVERNDTIRVHEENGFVWSTLENRLRHHFLFVQDAAEEGDVMFIDVCPRIEQFTTPVYARTWLQQYVVDLQSRMEALARERAGLVLWRRYPLEPVIRIEGWSLTLTASPEMKRETSPRGKFNRVDFRIHTGPVDQEPVPCAEQDGHFGKSNHFEFSKTQSLQMHWGSGETSAGTHKPEQLAIRQTELLASFAPGEIDMLDKKIVYIIEGYESLSKPAEGLDFAADVGNVNESKDTNYSQERAKAMSVFAAEDWELISTAGYGRTNVLRDFSNEFAYSFLSKASSSIEGETVGTGVEGASAPAHTEDTNGDAVQAEREEASAIEASSDPDKNEDAPDTVEEIGSTPVWVAVPQNMGELEKNQTAFLSVFLIDAQISLQVGAPLSNDAAYFLARSEASTRQTCIEPELIDQHKARLDRLTDYFRGKQFAPFKDITGLAPATVLMCSSTAAADGQLALSPRELASPLGRALSLTNAVDPERTRVGFLHSIDLGDRKNFYMFGSSLLTHFSPSANLEHIDSICDSHASIMISPDENIKLDLCEDSNLRDHEIETGALYHVRSNNTLSWLLKEHANCKSSHEEPQSEQEVISPKELTKECTAALKNPVTLFQELSDNENIFRVAIDVAFSLTDRIAADQ